MIPWSVPAHDWNNDWIIGKAAWNNAAMLLITGVTVVMIVAPTSVSFVTRLPNTGVKAWNAAFNTGMIALPRF